MNVTCTLESGQYRVCYRQGDIRSEQVYPNSKKVNRYINFVETLIVPPQPKARTLQITIDHCVYWELVSIPNTPTTIRLVDDALLPLLAMPWNTLIVETKDGEQIKSFTLRGAVIEDDTNYKCYATTSRFLMLPDENIALMSDGMFATLYMY